MTTNHEHGRGHGAGDKRRIDAAKAALGDAYDSAKDKTAAAYDAARERSGHAYASARGAAHDARERAADGIEDNPLIALAGGLAIGAVLGALIPRSQREIATLAPVGERIRDAAGSASKAAKVAAFDKIAELGLTKADLVAKARTVVAEAASAAKETGSAAADAARDEVRS